MHELVAACSAMFDATPLDLAVAVNGVAAAERLAATSPEAVLTQALHTWVFAHGEPGDASTGDFRLAQLLLDAGADPYCAVLDGLEEDEASFLQRLCASADHPDASKAARCGSALLWLRAQLSMIAMGIMFPFAAPQLPLVLLHRLALPTLFPLTSFAHAFSCRDNLLHAFSWLFSRDVKPGRVMSTRQLHQLLQAALQLGLTDQCRQLLRWPENCTTAEGPVAEERGVLLVLAVLGDQSAVLEEMFSGSNLHRAPRFDPDLWLTATEGGQHEPLLVHAVRHCSTATAAALLTGGANPNGDPGAGRFAVPELGLEIPDLLGGCLSASLLLGRRHLGSWDAGPCSSVAGLPPACPLPQPLLADEGEDMTALHWAVMRGDAHLVKLLLAAGAELEKEATPLMHHSEGGWNLETALLTAVLHRKSECIEALLEVRTALLGQGQPPLQQRLVAMPRPGCFAAHCCPSPKEKREADRTVRSCPRACRLARM